MTLVLGGFIIKDQSAQERLPAVLDPTEEQIDKAVALFATFEGQLGLRHQFEPERGPYRLSMQAEKEGVILKTDKWIYLLMLDQIEEDGDVRVRTIHNEEFLPGLAVHWGESYPSRARTRDLELVRTIFRQFARTGNVSEEIMS